jgi:hypothetical protein
MAFVLLALGSTLGAVERPSRPMHAVVAVLAASALVANAVLVFQSNVRDGRLASAAALLTPIAGARQREDARSPAFRAREIAAREQAALLLAREGWASSAFARAAAARQFAQLALLDRTRSDAFLDQAWEIVQDRAMRAGMPGLRADIAMLRLREGRLDAARCTQALEAVEAAALLAPHNPRRRLELGFALEAASSVEAEKERPSAPPTAGGAASAGGGGGGGGAPVSPMTAEESSSSDLPNWALSFLPKMEMPAPRRDLAALSAAAPACAVALAVVFACALTAMADRSSSSARNSLSDS